MKKVFIHTAFDNPAFKDFRFLEEASKLGELHVFLWSDELVQRISGKAPKFPSSERQYLLEAVRFVAHVAEWAGQANDTTAGLVVCRESTADAIGGVASPGTPEPHVIPESVLETVPPAPPVPNNPESHRKKVIVTGCYDWFHSGHVRFFEECSELGDLYVCVGHDANIRLLKGEGHPLFPAEQRRFIAGSIRYARHAIISTGDGWLDAEPEIARIKPDIYAVNEDGDKPEKRAFCEKNGIEYRVLKRLPKQGLPRRQSTALRGF